MHYKSSTTKACKPIYYEESLGLMEHDESDGFDKDSRVILKVVGALLVFLLACLAGVVVLLT